MVTVRTYWNSAQAALAKAYLDDCEIVCALLDENANSYCRAPFAAPIRLVVEDHQAAQANELLNGHPEAAAQIEEAAAETPPSDSFEPEAANQNPWEILAVAFAFLLPAICLLMIRRPHVVDESGYIRYVMARLDVTHFLAWLGIAFAGYLIVLYFRIRRSPEIEDPPAEDSLTPS